MENTVVGIVAIICTIGLPVILGMYFAISQGRQKHNENMELIKQGIVPSEKEKPIPNKYRSLRNGILFLGLGLGLGCGLLTGYALNINQDNMFWVIAPCILLGGGLAYIIFYILVRNKNLQEEE